MPGVSGQEELLYEGRPALVPGIGAAILSVLTLGIWLLVAWFQTRSVKYRITSQRIVVERGWLSKRMEQIDLYRVVDYVVERPFGQRIMGTGNLVLTSLDKSSPEIRIDRIKTDVVALYERLRFATEQEKRHRNMRPFEFDQG